MVRIRDLLLHLEARLRLLACMSRVPIYTLKELMGHKILAMTERYAHLAAEAKEPFTLRGGEWMGKAFWLFGQG